MFLLYTNRWFHDRYIGSCAGNLVFWPQSSDARRGLEKTRKSSFSSRFHSFGPLLLDLKAESDLSTAVASLHLKLFFGGSLPLGPDVSPGAVSLVSPRDLWVSNRALPVHWCPRILSLLSSERHSCSKQSFKRHVIVFQRSLTPLDYAKDW